MSAARKRKKLSNWQKLKSLVRPKSGFRRLLLAVAIVVGLIFGLTFSVLVYADSSHRGEMFPGTFVLGEDITGMTRDAAMATLEKALEPVMAPLTLRFKEKQWQITPAEFNFQVDKQAMVEDAYNMGWDRSIFERVSRRVFNKPLDLDIPIRVSYDREALKARLKEMSAGINQGVRDASLEFDFASGKLVFHPSQEGRKMDIDGTLAAVEEALASQSRDVEPAVIVTPPSLPDEKVQSVIVVNIMGNSLKLYNKDTLVKTYQVASGEPKFPTPLGKYYIIRKEANPVWVNPNVEWSKEMPPTIPPGPDNPLGMRALVTDAAGGTVLIHGTRYLTPGLYSHGCIRMANGDVVDLFDLVEVGSPVFIWTSSPVPPPPPEEGTPAGPEDPGLEGGANAQ